MKLVVVESPAKAKTIQQYLGKDYIVRSSKGHVVDLPKSGLAVDVEHDFTPTYVVTKPAVVKELKSEYKKADELVLAVDPDREGEAIGWHIAQELGAIDAIGRHRPKAKPVKRIVFTEITKEAVQAAAANPRELDMNLINAQQARRLLDRLVGYKLSPLLWKKIRYGLSAGRVQSVAVKLIVDRERERQKFVPQEYWSIEAFLDTDPVKQTVLNIKLSDKDVETDEEEELAVKGIKFTLQKVNGKKFDTDNQAATDKILQELQKADWRVVDVQTSSLQRNPFSPYSTSLLQQDASNKLGFQAWKTMQTAQKLYEAGLITYMRTDSLHFAQKAVDSLRKFIANEYGDKYVPTKPHFYSQKSKVAQEAHEAIRPTNFAHTPKTSHLKGDEARLYELIWRRAVASQMASAQLEQQKVIVDANDKYEFTATGRRVLFAGFLKVYADNTKDQILPELKKAQVLYAEQILGWQHFTQPPARFSEATLVKELESLGIGRPSTYAPIIQTILQRGYVEKLGRYFKPTDIGFVVTDLLSKHFPNIVDTHFTAGMEDELDDVAEGKQNWVQMLRKFYDPFAKSLNLKDKEIAKEDFTVLGESDEKCPECGSKMVIKLSKFGKFLSCSRFPECKGMKALELEPGEEGDVANQATQVNLDDYQPAPKTDDGRDYILKKGRFGNFWAHPDYPQVKDAKPLELKPEKLAEKYGQPPQTDDGRPYLLRRGRFGFFWAHPDYPKVKDIVPIKQAKKGGKFTKKSAASKSTKTAKPKAAKGGKAKKSK
jgi:DNA topoisomerase-1